MDINLVNILKEGPWTFGIEDTKLAACISTTTYTLVIVKNV